jgi:hypothetical protein
MTVRGEKWNWIRYTEKLSYCQNEVLNDMGDAKEFCEGKLLAKS